MRKWVNITPNRISMIEKDLPWKGVGAWLRKKPRTWKEFVEVLPEYAAWTIIHVPGCPINFDGLPPFARARIMSYRKDCPINLYGLGIWLKVDVMINREDCPLDFTDFGEECKNTVLSERRRRYGEKVG